jgi:predicted SAM-dependent methyltransferase
MNIKNYIIKKTNRETILYKIVDKLIFNISSLKYNLLYCFNKRKEIKKFDKAKTKKIQFGSSKNKLKGFLNTDVFGKIPIDITKKLPFKNDSIDLIYSSHLVEHIYLKEFIKFLKETKRILKRGGIQIIQTPSLEKASKIVYSKHENKDLLLNRHQNKHSRIKSKTPSEYLNDLIHLNFGHKYLYDFDFIKFLALNEGYSDVKRIKIEEIPEKEIKLLLQKKSYDWKLVTETIILIK